MTEQITYLYTVKSRGTIVISSMRIFTDVQAMKEHYRKKNSWDWIYLYQFVGDGPATLLTKKQLKELFK